jgi:hypothetical protein
MKLLQTCLSGMRLAVGHELPRSGCMNVSWYECSYCIEPSMLLQDFVPGDAADLAVNELTVLHNSFAIQAIHDCTAGVPAGDAAGGGQRAGAGARFPHVLNPKSNCRSTCRGPGRWLSTSWRWCMVPKCLKT